MVSSRKIDLIEYYLTPIRDFFDDDAVSEICVNRYDEVFVKRLGQMVRVPNKFRDEAEVKTLVSQIANGLGQMVNEVTHPVLDARLPDGTRVCAVLYPTATNGTCVTFRIFPKKRITGSMLVANETMTQGMFEFLEKAVICHANLLVSGSTDSGKTTILNVLSDFIPKSDRVITVEDTKELKVSSENTISLEAPSRDEEDGVQQVTMGTLIKTCLRKNPKRLIVGEIRDKNAAMAFLHAINTGHTAASTIHANSSDDALNRLQILASEDGLPFVVVEKQVRGNLHVLVHAEETDFGRKIVEIKEVIDGESHLIWEYSFQKRRHEKIHDSLLVKKRIETRYSETKI